MVKRRILAIDDQGCLANCGSNEDKDNLFVNCDFFGKLWSIIYGWLGFSPAFHGCVLDHLIQFGGLGDFSNYVRLSLKIIWLSVVWVI